MALQSRYVSVKASLDHVRPEEFAGFVLAYWPDATIVWAVHRESGKHPHTHFCIRFPSVRVWGVIRDWLGERDRHSYSEPGRSWRRSVRYLLHLDNPEKEPVPWEALDSRNIDDSELAQILGSPKQTIVEDVLSCAGMFPGKMLGFLLSRGYSFHEITACVNAFLSCGRFADFAKRNDVDLPASTFDVFDDDPPAFDLGGDL